MTKFACWNIYFSHKLIKKSGDNLSVDQQGRLDNIVEIIKNIDPDVLGIVECMPKDKLKYLIDNYLPGYRYVMQGNSSRLNLGLLYKSEMLEVREVNFNRDRWKDQLGDDSQLRFYKWTRVPLIAEVKDKASGRVVLVAVVHPKSKKVYSSGAEGEAEAYNNRKRIVAEGRRLHSIMWQKAGIKPEYRKFMIMGDINDGPWFDKYEVRILRSGVESHIGRVYEPDTVLHSFVDLADERGVSTTPASWGAPQLDHMLYTHSLDHGDTNPLAVPDSGRVRSDLVDFSSGSGKATDSDHIPVEVSINM